MEVTRADPEGAGRAGPAPVNLIETGLPDLRDAPMDADADIGDGEYERIFRTVIGGGGPVSAFNSSI